MMRMWRLWAVVVAMAAIGLGAAVAFAVMGGGDDEPVTSGPGGEPGREWRAPLHEARLDLADRLAIEPGEVSLVSARHAGFNGCLGVYKDDQFCTEQFLGGFIAIYAAGDKEYRYHFGGGRFIATDFVDADRIEDGLEVPPELQADLLGELAGYAHGDVALRTGQELEAVTVTAIVPLDFPNACLGLEREGEACAEVIVRGAVVLMIDEAGEEYRYHVSDQRVVAVSVEQGEVTVEPDTETLALQERMREDLAGRLGADVDDISVGSFELVTWPDGCLGVNRPGEVCTQALVDGFLALLVGPDGTEYRYHGADDRFIAASFEPDAQLGQPLPREE